MASDEGSILDPEFRRKLDLLDIVARKVEHREIRGERPSRDRGVGTLFADHRSYTPGDDLRYLDWNVYGRLGIPMTKEFEAETSLHVVLMIDASSSMDWGTPRKIDQARRLAAAFGYIALRRLDRVTVVVLGEKPSPPRRFHGKAQITGLFDALMSVECGGETDLAGLARLGLGTLRHAGLAILLTDFLDPKGYEGVLAELVRHRLRTLAFHLVSPDEADPEIRGALRLIDRETGAAQALEVTPAILREYREAFRRRGRAIEAFCGRRDVNYQRVSTTEPFDTPLLRLLRRRGVVR